MTTTERLRKLMSDPRGDLDVIAIYSEENDGHREWCYGVSSWLYPRQSFVILDDTDIPVSKQDMLALLAVVEQAGLVCCQSVGNEDTSALQEALANLEKETV